jgi:hypothetical protein
MERQYGSEHGERMPPLAPPPPRTSRWPIVAPGLAGIVFSLFAFLWMPWERVHPNDTTLRESIGYEPLWSHRFSNVPGAHVDWVSLVINFAIIWVVCSAAAVMLNMSARRD